MVGNRVNFPKLLLANITPAINLMANSNKFTETILSFQYWYVEMS